MPKPRDFPAPVMDFDEVMRRVVKIKPDKPKKRAAKEKPKK